VLDSAQSGIFADNTDGPRVSRHVRVHVLEEQQPDYISVIRLFIRNVLWHVAPGFQVKASVFTPCGNSLAF
jgi:hypothetical protein